MKVKKPLILISNDDGIDAPGLRVLIDCVADLGEVMAVAPSEMQSGKSSSLTFNSPLRVVEHEPYAGARMISIDGTPVDCIKMAVGVVLGRRPDFILSGVNHGSNAGNNLIYSGTMGAALEGCMLGIPSVGYSLMDHSWKADFSHCLGLIRGITLSVMQNGLPKGICLNVNFPAKAAIEGVKVVRSADSYWTEEYQKYSDPTGRPFYWLTGHQVDVENSPETDLYWLARNYATVVPVKADQNSTEAIAAVEQILK